MLGTAVVFFALSALYYMSTYASVHKSEDNTAIRSLFPPLFEFQGSNLNHQACVARAFTHQVMWLAFPKHTNYQMGQWVTYTKAQKRVSIFFTYT